MIWIEINLLVRLDLIRNGYLFDMMKKNFLLFIFVNYIFYFWWFIVYKFRVYFFSLIIIIWLI